MINYIDPQIWFRSSVPHDLVMTDGTLSVTGDTYTILNDTVTIRNNVIDTEAFEMHRSLCSEEQLTFGCCESGYIKFTIYDNISALKDKVLKVYIIPNHDVARILQLGVFKVVEDQLTADRTKRIIKAHDAMYDIINADVASWYNTELPDANSAKSLSQFRTDFLTHFGLHAEPVSLVNDNIIIKRTIEPQSLSGADVIKAICEINGVFGTITNTGVFRFVSLNSALDVGLYPDEDLYPDETLYPQDEGASDIPKSRYIDVQFEDYNVETITQVVVRTNKDDVGAVVGTEGNTYIVTGNFLVYGYTSNSLSSVATNLLNKISDITYNPATVTAIGNPCHELGDAISIHSTYRNIITYILKCDTKGIHALRDTYSATGSKLANEGLNLISTRFKQLSNRTTEIQADVDGFKVTVSETYVSKNGIVSDLNTKMDSSSISIEPSRITIKSTGGLVVNTPNFKLDASGNAEFKGTIRASTITGGTITGTAISGGQISTQSTQNGTIEMGNGMLLAYNSDASTSLLISAPSNQGGLPILALQEGGTLHYISINPRQATFNHCSMTLNYGGINILGSNGQDIALVPGGANFDSTTIRVRSGSSLVVASDATVQFNKYIQAQGTSDNYTLTLQTIRIGDKRYIFYAYERPD